MGNDGRDGDMTEEGGGSSSSDAEMIDQQHDSSGGDSGGDDGRNGDLRVRDLGVGEADSSGGSSSKKRKRGSKAGSKLKLTHNQREQRLREAGE